MKNGNNSNVPLVFIGMPVFNDVDFIEKSILSINNQTFRNWQLIISDDGSTDGSETICKRYAKNDTRITYIRQPINLGISKNMQYLLSLSNAEYFMWAGDDDLYAPEYIEKCLLALNSNTNIVSAFTGFQLINEKGQRLGETQLHDYSGKNAIIRLNYFIKHGHDAFGYGLFRTQAIKAVKFPVWWWPNRKTPYNNIYPTLCYYLAKGDYFLATKDSLFYKRIKTAQKTNHRLTGQGNGLKETLAFWIRKFNLVCFSMKQISKASTIFTSITVFPNLFYYWFIVPSWKQFLLVTRAFYKKRFK